jgi:hypothetical protein
MLLAFGQSSTATNCPLPKSCCNLIGHLIQLAMPLMVVVVEQLLLCLLRAIELRDTEAQQPHWQVTGRQTVVE